ncbi:MAG: Hpt domain-containing protein [Planctomycetota bacterium]|jgi:HPt (histidine-containing phosphotransfer) domain-containing protein|nr:Hpt domain-containing protein [Planctomycetota bacterium]
MGNGAVDWEKGLAEYGDREFYAEILRAYLVHAPATVGQLTGYLDQLASAEIRQAYRVAVHGLKGGCYSIKADGVGASALALETAAKNGDVDFIRRRHGEFAAQVQALTQEVQRWLDEEIAEKPVAVNPQLFALKLRALALAAQDSRGAVVSALLNELTAAAAPDDRAFLTGLRRLSDNIEYDAIAAQITARLA